MHSQTVFHFFMVVVISVGHLACSKKSSPAKISLQFAQKNQGLNTDSPIRHLVVNASATDMPLLSQEFDCRVQNCLNVNIEVPAGSNRLLQILMVYDTPATTQVLYGDVSQSLTSGDNKIEVSLSEIGNFDIEGEFQGRYIPSSSHPLAGKLLTGDVNMWARVGVNKPDMKITRTEIFGGWVRFMVLDNLGFRFTFDGFDRQGNFYKNIPLLNDLHGLGGMTLSSVGLQGAGTQIARYSSSVQIYDNGPDGTEQRPFETQIIGFLGSNPTNSFLCSNTLSAGYQFNGSGGRSRLCRDSSCSLYLTWGDINVQGSVDGTNAQCNPTLAPNEFPVSLENIAEKDKLIDFSGPLLGDGSNKSAHYNPATSELSWRLNPGAYLPEGIDIFVKENMTQLDWDSVYLENSDGYNCSGLADLGFQLLGNFTASGSMDLSSFATVNDPAVLICPRRRSGQYFSSAVALNSYGNYNNQPMATKLQITKPASFPYSEDLASGVCHPFIVQPVDDSDQPAYLMNPIDIDFTTNGINDNFYEDPSCTNVLTSSTGFYGNQQTVYYRSSNTTGAFTLTVTDSSPSSLSSGNLNLNSVTSGTLSSVSLVPVFFRKQSTFEMAETELCIPFYLANFDASGRLVSAGATVQFGNVNTDIYNTQSACEIGGAGLGTVDQYFAGPLGKFWLRRTTAATTISDVLTNCVDAGVTCQNQDLFIVSPGPFHHFHVEPLSGPSVYVNDCMQFKIGAYDDSKPHSYPVTFASAPSLPTFTLGDFISGTTTSFGGTFFTDGSCTAGASAPYNLTPVSTDTKASFQYRPSADGSLDLDVAEGTELLQTLFFNVAP